MKMDIRRIESVTEENYRIISDFYLGLQIGEHEFEPKRCITPEQAALMVNELIATFKKDKSFEYYIAYLNDVPAGFIEFGEEENIEDIDKKYIRINSLYVKDEFRKQGIGLALLTYAKERAKNLGYSQIGLGVVYKNAPAIALYKKFGLQEYSVDLMTTI